MTNQKLKEMSVGELVERFVAIAIDQDKAIFDEDNTKFNKLYDQMQSVKDELRARPGDQRNALRDMQVRLKAAITVLALAPDISKEVLRQIADSNRLPQAADAGLILNGLRDGSFVPS
jgi:Domain of unknown function (DUF2019)